MVRGRMQDQELVKARGGVWLAEGPTGGMELKVERFTKERTFLKVTLREGKNREIRRVFAKLGYPVISLKRVRIGHLSLHGLSDGAWRFLQADEVTKLRELAREEKPDGRAVAPANAFAERSTGLTRTSAGAARGAARTIGTESTGARTTRVRSTGTRSTGAKSTGARTTGAKSTGARTTGARTTGARTNGTKSTGPRSTSARSSAGKSTGRPSGGASRSSGSRSGTAGKSGGAVRKKVAKTTKR